MSSEFIHVVYCVRISFLFKTLFHCSILHIHIFCFFICSSVNGFCLSVLQSMDTWVVSAFWQSWILLLWMWLYKCLFEILLSFWYIPRSRIAKLNGHSLFKFLRKLFTVFHRGYYCFPFPPTVYKCSNLPTPLKALVMSCLFHFYNGYPNKSEVILHCDFDFHFPCGWWYSASFHLLSCCTCSSEKCLFRFFVQFWIGLIVLGVLFFELGLLVFWRREDKL